MNRILIIDNYDSFTYNLVHYLEDLDCVVTVKRNDELSIADVAPFDKIVISPGPGVPEEAGLTKEIIKHYATSKSILGICLGQQTIAEVFGGKLINLKEVFHGVSKPINITVENEYLFEGCSNTIEVGLYHSWIVDSNLPVTLEATSLDKNGNIMSLRHREYDIKGIQFHPESILTPKGKRILKNWINS